MFCAFSQKSFAVSKIGKKYNLDVIVFSAWNIEKLQPYLPFELKGDTSKWISKVNFYAKQYDKCLLIDDEISAILEKGCKGEVIDFENNIQFYQPKWEYGLVKKDFLKLNKLLKGMINE